MKTSKYLILGGGMVAGYAAKQFVESGLKPRELHIVSADSSIPYERPPSLKGFSRWERHGSQYLRLTRTTSIERMKSNSSSIA